MILPALTLLLILLFALAEGFFSGSETGLYVLNRVRLRLRAEAGEAPARTLWNLLEDLPTLITTILVGTNLCVFAASALLTRLLQTRYAHRAEYITTLILSPFLFVFAEVLPKNLFTRHAEVLMYRVGGWLKVANTVLRPIALLLRGVTALSVRLAGTPPPDAQDPLHSRERLLSLILTSAEEGLFTPYQQDMAENILRITSIPVRRVMVPMEQVRLIEEPLTAEKVLRALKETGYSRYPVRSPDGRIERVVEATAFLMARREGVPQAQDGLHPVRRLPADTPVPRALEILQTTPAPLGLVVENHLPVGIVTVKDLVEEIVGELGEW